MEKLTWFPADGSETITFSANDEEFMLKSLEGVGDTSVDPVSDKGPLQLGETFLTPRVDPKTITIQVGVLGDTPEEHMLLRQKLSGAMVVMMGQALELSEPGVLRYERYNLPPLEIEAVPVDSPSYTRRGGPANTVADIELWCPFPYWRSTEDSTRIIEEVGGVEYSLSYPLEYTEIRRAALIENEGTAPVQPRFIIHGEIVNPVILNVTTGQALELETSIGSGERVEIDTRFGRKSVKKYSEENEESNAFPSLILDNSEFFALERGVNEITLEGSPNVDGQLVVSWRELVGGV